MTQIDDLILISVDDHIIEPPDLFATHLPAKYLDRAPKLSRNASSRRSRRSAIASASSPVSTAALALSRAGNGLPKTWCG